MLTQDMLRIYKEKYNGHKIIYVRFRYEEFVFRTLTRYEYKILQEQKYNEEDLCDKVCNIGCLYPEGYDFSLSPLAGLSKFASKYITNLSGFDDIQEILKHYHNEKNNTSLESQCMDMIKAFMPEYTYEEMEDWTWEKLMKTTARAEKIAKLKGFDYHLNDRSEEMKDEYDKFNSDNTEFINNLYKNGIDPMTYFAHEFEFTKPVLDFPLIIGKSFDNEEVLDAVKKQIKDKEVNDKLTKRYL